MEITAILFLILVPIASFQLNDSHKDQELIDIEPSQEYQDHIIQEKFKKELENELLRRKS